MDPKGSGVDGEIRQSVPGSQTVGQLLVLGIILEPGSSLCFSLSCLFHTILGDLRKDVETRRRKRSQLSGEQYFRKLALSSARSIARVLTTRKCDCYT